MQLPVTLAPLPEDRRAVDDGYLWPVRREAMTQASPIRQRMVEDIAALVQDGGCDAAVSLQDLGRKGWSADQLAAHGRFAFAIFNAEHAPRRTRRVTGNRDTVRRVSSGFSAMALGLFLAPVLLFFGIAAGAL